MKKRTVVALIVAVVLIFVGGILLTLGLSFADAGEYTAAEKTYVVGKSFDSILVEATVCDVVFQRTDGEFRAVCPDSEKLSYTVTVEENTLYIRQVDLRQWYDFIGIYQRNQKMTVYLPEVQYDTLRIETDTGDIHIPEDFSFGTAEIFTSTGDVDCAAQVTEELSVTTDTGDIGIQGVSCKVLTCESDTGDIALESCDAGALEIQSSTGDVTLCNVLLTGQMKLRTTTGDVNILGCDADTADIQTSTGDVFGKFLTSKWFHAVSDTGDVSVPMTREGGVCSIITDTGDITFSYSPTQPD